MNKDMLAATAVMAAAGVFRRRRGRSHARLNGYERAVRAVRKRKRMAAEARKHVRRGRR